MLLEAIGATACAGACSMAWAVRGRSSSVFGPSVYRGAADRPAIALTFDDGPSESTPQLLDLLEETRTRATFFFCGANVRRLAGTAREVAQAGHQIGNHSDSHARLYLRSASFIEGQIVRAQQSISEVTGVEPLLFRAPYGVRWFGMREVQQRLGLLGVMWTVSGLDWKLSEEAIVRRLVRRARNGAIFCLHEWRLTQARPKVGPTIEAVRRLIPELSAKGYRFETVSQILCPTT